MIKHRLLPLLIGALLSGSAGADSVDTTMPGEPVERHLSGDQPFRRWSQDPGLLDSERGDKLAVQKVPVEKLEKSS
jgi:hypothetical protein